ncbi:hypothetical protein HMPREF0995_02116 [Lachnospiraceae bacterium 7_1_58FAA]|nr:hypothetical protein HMPREF0995_02116 [Lachnospiraceae bacterium 7_1_58FAA]
MTEKRHQWASNLGFILAAAGSAVGLGNIWKFPGKVGAYGGGAFLLCYLLIVFLVGFPVMLAELSIGRATQKNVVGAFRTLNPRWRFAGYIGIVTLFVILSYYCVVGGWVLKYVQIYAAGAHFGAGPGAYADYFSAFSARPVEPLLWGLGFLVLCIVVVVRGVSQGIEKVSKVLMPLLFLLLAGLVVYSVTRPGAGEGLRFLFGIDPARLSGDTLVGALGQAFFSLSVGMGIMVTYGSYVPKSENLAKSAGWICALDTLVAVMAALAIVPVVMITQGEEGLGMGGGFAFISLPAMFAELPGGRFFGTAFFALLFLAALTSAISILESLVAFLTEEFHLSRARAAIGLSVPMALLSAGYSLSQSAGRGHQPALVRLQKRAADAPHERGDGEVHRQSDDPSGGAVLLPLCGLGVGHQSRRAGDRRRARPPADAEALGLRGALSRPSGHRGHPVLHPRHGRGPLLTKKARTVVRSALFAGILAHRVSAR